MSSNYNDTTDRGPGFCEAQLKVRAASERCEMEYGMVRRQWQGRGSSLHVGLAVW